MRDKSKHRLSYKLKKKRELEIIKNRDKKYSKYMKNTQIGMNSILNDTEEQIRELEYRVVKITGTEQKKKKKKKRKRNKQTEK